MCLLALLAGAWAAQPIWVLDLGASDGRLLSGGETGQWAWGQPTVGPVTYGNLWGTNLNGPYLHDTTDWLQVTLPDLSGLSAPTLVLTHWYAVRAGDSALLQLDSGSGFIVLDPAGGYPDPMGFVGQSGAMVEHVWALSGTAAAPTVRLVLTADAAQSDAGWYVQSVAVWDGDLVVPTIAAVTEPADTQDLVSPYLVEVDVVDDRALTSVTLWMDTGAGPSALPMTAAGGARWRAFLPAQPPDTTVSWWVEASDGENVGRYPASGARSFRVFLAAPTGLAAVLPGERPVATSVLLIWDAPDSPHPVLGYEVRREDVLLDVANVEQPQATVGLAGDAPQTFTVTALYEAGPGDPSEPLALDIEVPKLVSVEPPVGYAGEELYLKLSGQSLYLLQSMATLDLGPDVEILEIEVRDANALTAHVRIASEVTSGPVDVKLGSSAGTFLFPDGFVLRGNAEAPHIERIEPSEIHQGQTAFIELQATELFAAIPTVGTDEELLVTSAVTVEGDIARFELAAAGRARPGPHTLSIDDGKRLYTVDIEVKEVRAQVRGGCCSQGEAGRGTPLLPALAALLWLRIRRSPLSARAAGV